MGKDCGVIINRAGLGDKGVYQYLDNEKIPLLMEIPFNREIASIYSKGNVVAKEKPELQKKLIDVFDLVCDSIASK
jgi:MinD superfamily P-loop ATPase